MLVNYQDKSVTEETAFHQKTHFSTFYSVVIGIRFNPRVASASLCTTQETPFTQSTTLQTIIVLPSAAEIKLAHRLSAGTRQ